MDVGRWRGASMCRSTSKRTVHIIVRRGVEGVPSTPEGLRRGARHVVRRQQRRPPLLPEPVPGPRMM